MKGLIRNNIYSMQSNLLVSFLIALVLGVLPLFIQGDGILQMVISMQIYVFIANVGSSLHADELSGWDRFEITLPVCRSQIVQAKYLTFVLLFALGIGAGTLTLGGLWLTGRAPAFRDVLHGYAFGLTLSALSTAILYPLVLKFGTDKSDVFLILSGLVVCDACADLRYSVFVYREHDEYEGSAGGCGVCGYGIGDVRSVLLHIGTDLAEQRVCITKNTPGIRSPGVFCMLMKNRCRSIHPGSASLPGRRYRR